MTNPLSEQIEDNFMCAFRIAHERGTTCLVDKPIMAILILLYKLKQVRLFGKIKQHIKEHHIYLNLDRVRFELEYCCGIDFS